MACRVWASGSQAAYSTSDFACSVAIVDIDVSLGAGDTTTSITRATATSAESANSEPNHGWPVRLCCCTAAVDG